MIGYVLIFMIVSLTWLFWKLLREPECDHSEQIYYDASLTKRQELGLERWANNASCAKELADSF